MVSQGMENNSVSLSCQHKILVISKIHKSPVRKSFAHDAPPKSVSQEIAFFISKTEKIKHNILYLLRALNFSNGT
jgi:hypothetical protein